METTETGTAQDPLLKQHRQLIEASGISPDVADARGYRSVTKKVELRDLGFTPAQSRVPALLIPIWGVAGQIVTFQARPDQPRVNRDGKPTKYETPGKSRMALDVHPNARPLLGDPVIPLIITEGVRKADAAISRDLCCVALLGVWNWRGTNREDGKTALPEWENVALNGRQVFITFDSDVMTKPQVHAALSRLKRFLEYRGATVAVIYLPPGPGGTKTGLDDYLAAGHSDTDLLGLATPEIRAPVKAPMEPGAQSALPVIETSNRKLSAITADTLKAITLANRDQLQTFQEGGALVRLSLDGDGRRRADIFTADSARHDFDVLADFIRTDDKGNEHTVFPPVAVIRSVLLRPSYSLPRLRGVVAAPFFTREGRLVSEPGYDSGAELYLDPPAGFVMPPISREPTDDEVMWARRLILEPFCDFPFESQASQAHTVALVLAPFIRDMVAGPTPLFAIDAHKWGSGKSLLMSVASVIASGIEPSNTPMGGSDEELRKRITATLLNPQPYVVIDNVRRQIEGESLALMLTTAIWHDRILGVSKMARIPVRAIAAVTGNTLRFSGEITRRTVIIKLVPATARPWERTGFRYPELISWVKQNRGELMWAALTLAQRWIATGCPPFVGRAIGSYESWARVTGGILGAAGIAGFLGNADQLHERDEESAAWNSITAAWQAEHQGAVVMAEDLLKLVNDVAPAVLGDGNERSQLTRLGRALGMAASAGAVFANQLSIVQTTSTKGRRERRAYFLVKVPETPSNVGHVGHPETQQANSPDNSGDYTTPTKCPTSSEPADGPAQRWAPKTPINQDGYGDRPTCPTSDGVLGTSHEKNARLQVADDDNDCPF